MKLDLLLNGKSRSWELVSGESQDGWREFSIDRRCVRADIVEVSPGVYSVLVDGMAHEVRMEEGANGWVATVHGRTYALDIRDPRRWTPRSAALAAGGAWKVCSPMPDKILRLLVAEGDQVAEGGGLIVVEAMKMQNELTSPKAGRVRSVEVAEGSSVTTGQTLIVVD